ncbi:MAG: sodium/proline symporter PutP [Alphaproteobacteria bacterium]|nr:sodium/proline symporter PutP [Alphaproteobacteria bacterium]
MNGPLLITFVAYLFAMLALGLAAYRITETLPDYILGGRRLGPVVAALSAGASDMSGWLLLGLPGAVYAFGLNQIWIAIGLALGAYLNWRLIAPRLRRYTEAAPEVLTLPEYLESRFLDESGALRILSAIVILFFFTIYTAAGLVAGAILFEETFGLDYATALGVGTVVIVAYTLLGGFLAVSWTDVVQGGLMFLALIAVPVMATFEIGGWDAAIDRIGSYGAGRLDIFSGVSVIGIISLMAWGLGYFGQPHILARFMALRSSKDAPTACLVGMSWMVISLYGAVFTGFIAIGYYNGTSLENPETAFIALTRDLFTPWVAGCLLAAVLAAVMSTVDSQLLVCSSALTEDIYRAAFRKQAADRELVWIGRGAVVVIALIATVIAADPDSRVLSLVAYAWAGFGAGFGPPLIVSLLWPQTTRNGVLAGMPIGAIIVVGWANLEGGIFDIYEILPGFLAGLITILVVSSAEGAPPDAVRDRIQSL